MDGIPNLPFTFNSANDRITTDGFQYDSAGNQTRALGKDGIWLKYEYDAPNRIRVVKHDDGSPNREDLRIVARYEFPTVQNPISLSGDPGVSLFSGKRHPGVMGVKRIRDNIPHLSKKTTAYISKAQGT